MTAASIVSAVTGTSLVGFVLTQAAGAEPWWIAAVVVPLAGFSAWLVRWILQKQDERDKATAERDKATADRETRREAREEKRAEHAELQTRALQECVAELRTLNEQQEAHGKALAAVPERVAERLGQHPPRVST